MGGKIGIGVILYEKGKGKFVGDWKNPPHKNCKQTKGIFVQLLRCKAKQLNSFEQGLEWELFFKQLNSEFHLLLFGNKHLSSPPLFCCGYIITLKKQKVKCFCTTKLLNVCEYCTKKLLTDLFTINSKLFIWISNFYADLTKIKKK